MWGSWRTKQYFNQSAQQANWVRNIIGITFFKIIQILNLKKDELEKKFKYFSYQVETNAHVQTCLRETKLYN